MATISHVVARAIRERPFIADALHRGIINHAALAHELLPRVEKELGEKIAFPAVHMAVRRAAERLADTHDEHVFVDAHSNLTMRSHLVALTVYASAASRARLQRLYEVIDIPHGEFLTITQGLHEVMIITNAPRERDVLHLFPRDAIRTIERELASVTVHLSPKSVHAPGAFSLVTRELAWEHINIVDIVSTYTEMTFLVSERDAPRAFMVLGELLSRHASGSSARPSPSSSSKSSGTSIASRSSS